MLRTLKLLNQNCRLATRLVSESHDRELDRSERTGLTIHLLGCRSCRRYRDQLQILEQLVKSADSSDVKDAIPPAARERIFKRLSHSRTD